MKKIIVKKLLFLFVFCLSYQLGFCQPTPTNSNSYHPNQLIIEIDPASPSPSVFTGTSAFTELGGVPVDSIIDGAYYKIYLVEFELPDSNFNNIREVHDFYECGDAVGPQNHVFKTKKSDFNYLLSTNVPTSAGGVFDFQNYVPYSNCLEPYIGVPTISAPCNTLKVAVIDTGYELGTTFDDRILFNEGYDFVEDDSIAMGQHWHGTGVCSVTAGETHNNKEEISFFHVRVLDSLGNGQLWQALEGIDYGIDHAEILVVSLEAILREDDICTVIYESLLDKADQENTLIVAAAGNSNLNIDPSNFYSVPGSGQGETLVVVGASSCFQDPSDFSNFGVLNVDLFAPGEDINVYPNLLATGTSFAAPQIASVAATFSLTSPVFDAHNVKSFVMENVINRNWIEECVTGGTFDYSADFGSCPSSGGKRNREKDELDQMISSLSMKAYFSANDLSLTVSSAQVQKANLEVIDLSGSIVLSQNVILEKGNNSFKLNNGNIEQVEVGLFILRLRTEKGLILHQKCMKLP